MNADALINEVMRAFDRGVAFGLKHQDFIEENDSTGYTLNSREAEDEHYNETHIMKVRIRHLLEDTKDAV